MFVEVTASGKDVLVTSADCIIPTLPKVHFEVCDVIGVY